MPISCWFSAHKTRPMAPAVLCAGIVAVSVVALASGCGSRGGGDIPFTTNPVTATPAPSASSVSVVGRSYTSRVSLANGQTGTLTATVAADNSATGTLEIVDPSRQAATTRLVIATPFVSGTFDPATGKINLTGSYTVNGRTIPISIVGTLPAPPSFTGGSLTTTVDGQSYTSTFGNTTTTTPTPTPSASASASPSPSPSASASPSPSPSATPAPGVVNQITVTGDAASGANNTVSVLNAVRVGAGVFHSAPVTGGGYVSLTITNKVPDSTAPETTMEVVVYTGGPLATGTFPVKAVGITPGTSGAQISYNEFAGGQHNWQSLISKTPEGEVVIEQVDTTKVRVRLVNVRVDAYTFLSPAKGFLHLNGTVETTSEPLFAN